MHAQASKLPVADTQMWHPSHVLNTRRQMLAVAFLPAFPRQQTENRAGQLNAVMGRNSPGRGTHVQVTARTCPWPALVHQLHVHWPLCVGLACCGALLGWCCDHEPSVTEKHRSTTGSAAVPCSYCKGLDFSGGHACAASSAVAWPLLWLQQEIQPQHSCALEPLVSGHIISRLCHWYNWARSRCNHGCTGLSLWQGYIGMVKKEDRSAAGQPPIYIYICIYIYVYIYICINNMSMPI